MWYKLNKWFELNLGWFFTHPNRQEQWAKHLKKKYGKTK